MQEAKPLTTVTSPGSAASPEALEPINQGYFLSQSGFAGPDVLIRQLGFLCTFV